MALVPASTIHLPAPCSLVVQENKLSRDYFTLQLPCGLGLPPDTPLVSVQVSTQYDGCTFETSNLRQAMVLTLPCSKCGTGDLTITTKYLDKDRNPREKRTPVRDEADKRETVCDRNHQPEKESEKINTAAFILGGMGVLLILVFLSYTCLKAWSQRVTDTTPPEVEGIMMGPTSPDTEATTVEEVWGDLCND